MPQNEFIEKITTTNLSKLSDEDRRRLLFGDWTPHFVVVRNRVGGPRNLWLGVEVETGLKKPGDDRSRYSAVIQLVNPRLEAYRNPFRIVRASETFDRDGISLPEREAVLKAWDEYQRKKALAEKHRPRNPRS